jgi:hypothetical protein
MRRTRGSRVAWSTRFIMLAIVPPLIAPFVSPAKKRIAPQRASYFVRAYSCSISTPRSDGIESYPHECTMRAPVFCARPWCWSIMSRMNGVSPARST